MSGIPTIPGFGWTTPSQSKVELYPESVFVEASVPFCEAPCRLAGAAGWVLPTDFELVCETALSHYFNSPLLQEELREFMTTGESNSRKMRWNLMKIASNTSFRLHAHQNIEVIYVLKGSMCELRMVGTPPQRIFSLDEKDGPNLSNPDFNLQFITRKTSAVSASVELQNTMNSFLINEKGSIHLSYTVEDGAELLVLWSGGHGNIPLDQLPPAAGEVLKLPETVLPM